MKSHLTEQAIQRGLLHYTVWALFILGAGGGWCSFFYFLWKELAKLKG